jgi:hypothetical protein
LWPHPKSESPTTTNTSGKSAHTRIILSAPVNYRTATRVGESGRIKLKFRPRDLKTRPLRTGYSPISLFPLNIAGLSLPYSVTNDPLFTHKPRLSDAKRGGCLSKEGSFVAPRQNPAPPWPPVVALPLRRPLQRGTEIGRRLQTRPQISCIPCRLCASGA